MNPSHSSKNPQFKTACNNKQLNKTFSKRSKIPYLIVLGIIGFLIYAIIQISQPQDLSDIEGFKNPKNAPNLLVRMQSGISSRKEIYISPEELNRYIAAKQNSSQKEKNVGIRLHDGFIEIIMEHVILGEYKHTTSLYLTITRKINSEGNIIVRFELKGEKFLGIINKSGKIGLFETLHGQLPFVLEDYIELSDLFQDERKLLPKIQKINISPKGIILTPQ